MNREHAEKLVSQLELHADFVFEDTLRLVNFLVARDIPESSRFYESLLPNRQEEEDGTIIRYFSFRRILRNRNAQDYYLAGWKKVIEYITNLIGFYSSDVLTRNLRTNKDLVEMMAENEHPYSLLGKLTTYDHGRKPLHIITRPILVIPDAKDTLKILSWEGANSIYEKESGIYGIRKRITKEEYLAGHLAR